jgi:diguanylate cyclase (GGDEF)-like protein
MIEVARYISDKLGTLKVRILGGIFLIFFLAITMVVYGVWTYQRDRFIDLTSRKAMQLSDVIIAGLRSSMLQNNPEETMRDIDNILRVAGTERISILNADSRVKMTSDPKFAGKVFNKMTDPSCGVCHASGKKMGRTAVVEVGGERFINTVTVIPAEPACFGCHPKGSPFIGILLVESSFRETEIMLEKMAKRIGLTGVMAFLVGVLLLNYIVTRFFTRPLEALRKGFERVGQGDFTCRVEVKTRGEIGYMADSFNRMSETIDRYVNEINEKTEEVGAYYAIVNDLSQTIDKNKLTEVVVELLYRLLKAECAALALVVDNHPNSFEIVRIQSADKRHYHDYYNTESGTLEVCALTREDLVALAEKDRPAVSYLDNGSKLLISLVHKNIVLGVVSVVKPEKQRFSKAEKKIIPVLVHHLALSFANAQLYSIAITDGLTTLYTKRHFDRKIREFIHNFYTTKRGFCLLIMDIDHFKQVNDEHGHPVGDKVLERIADLIHSSIRHGDIPFRYGGEEFTVLLKGDDIEGAVRIAERIRRSVEETMLHFDDAPPLRKTISVGVACFPHHYSTAEEIITAADKALYKAKSDGRNRVIVYCRSMNGGQDCG